MQDQSKCNPCRKVFGLSFATETRSELSDAMSCDPNELARMRMLVTAKVDHIVSLRANHSFQKAYNAAWRVTADGKPILLYANFRGARLPDRITGADLFNDLCEKLRPGVHRIFMLASNQGTAEKVRAFFLSRGFEPGSIVVEVPPFGFDQDDAYSRAMVERIRKVRPTHLVMGVGAPKSEIWAYRHRRSLGPMFVLCVGAALEFFAGDKPRAPAWMGRAGLEWLHRFASEPRRLFHRYFVRSWGILGAIAQDFQRPT